MRWRGLAPPGCASAPMTRRPECYPAAHRIPAPPEFAGLPATPAFPWDFARGDWPAFGGERISTACVAGRTRCSASKYKILLAIHRTCCPYPPKPAEEHALSTASCTVRSTGASRGTRGLAGLRVVRSRAAAGQPWPVAPPAPVPSRRLRRPRADRCNADRRAPARRGLAEVGRMAEPSSSS